MRPQGLRLRRGRRLHGCRICFLFFRVILSQWSGCKSSTRLWMWLWTHPLPLVSLPRLLIPGIRQLLLRLLRRAASPTNSPVFSPPPWVTVTASPLPSPPTPPLLWGSSPGSSWQLERTFNNEKKNIIAFMWLKPSSGFSCTWDQSQRPHLGLQCLRLLEASLPEA